MPKCGGLGIYRRRTFSIEVRQCMHGHRLVGHNLESNARGVNCRPCHLLRKRRWYWAKQLESYWRALRSPNGPVTEREVQPIISSGAGSRRRVIDDPGLATRG